jgi:hypothetical protein
MLRSRHRRKWGYSESNRTYLNVGVDLQPQFTNLVKTADKIIKALVQSKSSLRALWT